MLRIRFAAAFVLMLFSGLTIAQNDMAPLCPSSDPIQELVQGFEDNLKGQYQLMAEPTDADYRRYVEDLRNMSLPRSFFTAPQRVKSCQLLQQQSIFFMLWERQSKIKENANPHTNPAIIESPSSFDTPQIGQQRDDWVVNPRSIFFQCLVSETKHSDLKALLREYQSVPDISPGLMAYALLDINQFDEQGIRAFIALHLYYSFVMGINGLNQ
ncbi:MAG: hypothetical protein AAFV95_06825 [Bacteroidota bacterium]